MEIALSARSQLGFVCREYPKPIDPVYSLDGSVAMTSGCNG